MKKNTPNENQSLDGLLDKYISIWLWSMIFGAVTGTLYSILSYNSFESRWGSLSLIVALILTMSAVFAFQASLYLLRGFSDFLIPKYVLRHEVTEDQEIKFARGLRQAFSSLILSVMIRVILGIAQLVLYALGNGLFF